MSKHLHKNIFLLVGISMMTMSLISFEILLTRLFSPILAYHFAFLVTSLAILGLGMGGMIAYRYEQISKVVAEYNIILPISYLVISLSIYIIPFQGNLAVYSVLATIPFLIAGIIIATIFKKNAQISNKIYFADLLGSALGSLAILLLLNQKGFGYSLFTIGLLGAIGCLFLGGTSANPRKIILTLISIFLIGTTLYQGSTIEKIESNFMAYFTSPSTVISLLKDTERSVKSVDFIGWNAMARTDVLETLNENERIIITDGGASAPMVRFSGDFEEVEYLKKEIGFIPFSFGTTKNSLIIGSGGGKDVLFALLGGVNRIDAVEINPLTIKAVNQYKDFNGGIYDMPGVNVYIGDGRSFIEKTQKKYDSIFLSLVMANAVENSALAMSEGYVFTQEAIEKYLDLLTEEGKLSFVMHSSADLLRGLNTVIQGLLSRGVPRDEILDYFIVVNSGSMNASEDHVVKVHMPVLMVKKNPFTESEYQHLLNIIETQERSPIHVGEITILKDYVDFARGESEFKNLVNISSLNLQPVTDQNPFFYNYSRGASNTLKALLLVSTLTLIGLYKTAKKSGEKGIFVYFTLLGVAFMLVEIPLIQKMVLFLGSPTHAFTYVLFILLVSGGIGSLFSNLEIWEKYSKNKYAPLLLNGFLLFSQSISIRVAIPMFMDARMGVKLILIIFLVSPLGFFMGMPFPRGIRALGEYGQGESIPLMWGVNGVASVLGAALALTLSMGWGFYASEALAGIIYLTLFATEFIKGRV